jgi:hypothetical protein
MPRRGLGANLPALFGIETAFGRGLYDRPVYPI